MAGFLENLLNRIDEGKANKIVDDVNEVLITLETEYEGLFTDAERDAMRHYFGTIELAKEYGGTVAWFSGLLHEGFDFTKYGQDLEQSIADKKNNAKALKDFDKGEHIELVDIVGDHGKLRDVVSMLTIPPAIDTGFPKGDNVNEVMESAFKPSPARENVQTYNMGYNPTLDRTDEE